VREITCTRRSFGRRSISQAAGVSIVVLSASVLRTLASRARPGMRLGGRLGVVM
jgi:hypothetical protein